MGTVNDKIIETLEMGYILGDKTIWTPPIFPILTSPLPKQSKLLCCLAMRKWSKGTKLTPGEGEERLASEHKKNVNKV